MAMCAVAHAEVFGLAPRSEAGCLQALDGIHGASPNCAKLCQVVPSLQCPGCPGDGTDLGAIVCLSAVCTCFGMSRKNKRGSPCQMSLRPNHRCAATMHWPRRFWLWMKLLGCILKREALAVPRAWVAVSQSYPSPPPTSEADLFP